MQNTVKERLLHLVGNKNQSYYNTMNFFLDPDLENYQKEKVSKEFLENEMNKIDEGMLDFPSLDKLKNWIESENIYTRIEFQKYLARRKEGEKREYFANVGEALEFLIKVAPVKKVDGAWLYSMVKYWNDPDFHDLLVIYLEELGSGQPQANHVCLFNKLLRQLDIEDWNVCLEDGYYQKAAIQLALGYAPPEFIPEIIGYNLGYEQLPLHLLITNFELSELGIDSSYFNLHITIDNLDNGHAYKSIKSIEKIMRKFRDKEKFYNKLIKGYALNYIGIGSRQIISDIHLESFVMNIIKKKAVMGRLIHNNKCVFKDKTINQWLSTPQEVENFMRYLIESQWIKLGEDPENSRFWKLVNGESSRMFGVFSLSERMIIYDWINGSSETNLIFKAHCLMEKTQNVDAYLFNYVLDEDLQQLQSTLSMSQNVAFNISKLIPYLSPDSHHKIHGLWATEKFTQLLFPKLLPTKA